MAGKRKIRITIERDRVWIIRQCGTLARKWCERCGADVEFVSVEQASAVTGRSIEEVRHSALNAKLHISAGGGKELCICLRSLLEGMPVLKSLKAPP